MSLLQLWQFWPSSTILQREGKRSLVITIPLQPNTIEYLFEGTVNRLAKSERIDN